MSLERRPLLWGGVFIGLVFLGIFLKNQLNENNKAGSEDLASALSEEASSQKKDISNKSTQEHDSKSQPSSLEELLTEKGSSEKWTLKKEGDVVRVAYGGVVRNRALKRDDVDQFIEEFLDKAGVEHKQRVLSREHTVLGTEENILSYDQAIDKTPIYGAHLKVFVRKPDFGITYVINEFTNFVETRSQRNLADQEVEERVVSVLTGKAIKTLDCAREVYFVKDETAYLSRVCKVDVARPLRDVREIVVDLGAGEILKNVSLVIAN